MSDSVRRFQLALDEETTKKIFKILNQQGLTQVGFEARESGGGGVRIVVTDDAPDKQN